MERGGPCNRFRFRSAIPGGPLLSNVTQTCLPATASGFVQRFQARHEVAYDRGQHHACNRFRFRSAIPGAVAVNGHIPSTLTAFRESPGRQAFRDVIAFGLAVAMSRLHKDLLHASDVYGFVNHVAARKRQGQPSIFGRLREAVAKMRPRKTFREKRPVAIIQDDAAESQPLSATSDHRRDLLAKRLDSIVLLIAATRPKFVHVAQLPFWPSFLVFRVVGHPLQKYRMVSDGSPHEVCVDSPAILPNQKRIGSSLNRVRRVELDPFLFWQKKNIMYVVFLQL